MPEIVQKIDLKIIPALVTTIGRTSFVGFDANISCFFVCLGGIIWQATQMEWRVTSYHTAGDEASGRHIMLQGRRVNTSQCFNGHSTLCHWEAPQCKHSCIESNEPPGDVVALVLSKVEERDEGNAKGAINRDKEELIWLSSPIGKRVGKNQSAL